jgi:hypothetical protein
MRFPIHSVTRGKPNRVPDGWHPPHHCGAILTPFLCGAGVLFVIIGAVMWAREG